MSRIRVRKYLLFFLSILLFAIASAPAIVCVYAVLSFLFVPRNPSPNFCTENDVIYETMSQNAEKWIERFHSDKRRVISSLPFPTLKENASIIVNIAGLGDSAWQEVLFVVTQDGWNERMGLSGYIYSPIGKPDVPNKYDVKYSGNFIYCYTRKSEY